MGGRTLAEQHKHSAYFDIKITDESNTKAEKARYIREAFGESYIHVQDVRAAAYGHGGRSQEWRYQHQHA